MQPVVLSTRPTQRQHRSAPLVSNLSSSPFSAPFSFSLLITAPPCSLPEKYRKLVHIFNPSASHIVTTQPPSKKQQPCAYSCSCPRYAFACHCPTYPTSRVSTTTITGRDGRVAAPSTNRPTCSPAARPSPNDTPSLTIDLLLAPTNGRDTPRATHTLRLVYRRRSHNSSCNLDAPETWRRRELRGPRFGR